MVHLKKSGKNSSVYQNQFDILTTAPLTLDWHKLTSHSKSSINQHIDSAVNHKTYKTQLADEIYSGLSHKGTCLESYRRLYMTCINLCTCLHISVDANSNSFSLNKEDIKELISIKLRELAELHVKKQDGLGSLFQQNKLFDVICDVLVDCQSKNEQYLQDYFNDENIQNKFIDAFNDFCNSNSKYPQDSKKLYLTDVYNNIHNIINFTRIFFLNSHLNTNGNNLLSINGYRTKLLDNSSKQGLENLEGGMRGNLPSIKFVYNHGLKDDDENKYRQEISSYLGQICLDNNSPFTRAPTRKGMFNHRNNLTDFSKKPDKGLFCLEQIIFYLEKTGHIDNVLNTAMLGKNDALGNKLLSSYNNNLLLRNLYSLNTQVIKYNAKNPSNKIYLSDLLNRLSQVNNTSGTNQFIEYIENITNNGIAIPKYLISALIYKDKEEGKQQIEGLVNSLLHVLDNIKPNIDKNIYDLDKIKHKKNQDIYSSIAGNINMLKFLNTDHHFLFRLKKNISVTNLQKANINILNPLFNSSFIFQNAHNNTNDISDNICLHRDICIQALTAQYAKINLDENSSQASIFDSLSKINDYTQEISPILQKIDSRELNNINNLQESYPSIIAVLGNKSIPIFRGNIPDDEDDQKFQKFESKEELENYLADRFTENSSGASTKNKISYYELNPKAINQVKELSYNTSIIGDINKKDIDILTHVLEELVNDIYEDDRSDRSSKLSFLPEKSIDDLPKKIPEIEIKEIDEDEDSYEQEIDDKSDTNSISPLISPADIVDYSSIDMKSNTPISSQNINTFYSNELKKINEKFNKATRTINTSYEEGIRNAQTILSGNLGILKNSTEQAIQHIKIQSQQKLKQINNNAEDRLSKLIDNLSINDLDNTINIDETLQILSELKSSLNDIKKEYIKKQEQENNKYNISTSEITSKYNNNLRNIKKDSQQELSAFQAGLSNLTNINQQIESMKRRIVSYGLGQDEE